MSVSYGATSTTTRGSGTSPVCTHPSGISAGDLLVMAVYVFKSGGETLSASGWTAVPNSPSPISSSIQVHVFTKEATGSESGSQAISTTGTLTGYISHMMRFSRSLGAWDSHSAGSGSESATNWSMTTTQSVERISGDMLVAFACGNGASGALRTWSSETIASVSATAVLNIDHTSQALQGHTSYATAGSTANNAVTHAATLNTNQAGNGLVLRLRDLSTHVNVRSWGAIPIKADS